MTYEYIAGNTYFLTCKTVNSELFFIDDEDKQIILDKIKSAERKYNLNIQFYSIVSNHYHFLFYSENYDDIKKALQLINGGSSYLLNKKKNQNCKIWENNKFNWVVKDNDSYFRIMGYIVGNPFKHGLVSSINDLEKYNFCNYNEAIETYGREFVDNIINDVIRKDFNTL